MSLIYLDNHATTRLDPRALERMLPYFTEAYGNASSRSHALGWRAEESVVRSRAQIADLVGADPREIVFTSGATESNNLAIQGVAAAYRDRGDHIVTVATEHKAVLDTCRHLASRGLTLTVLPVDSDGRVSAEQIASAITERTILVSVMTANNEIGVIAPVAEIGARCRERGVLFHTDAAQALGRVPLDVNAMHIDLMSLSAHKMHGPKGVGALYVRRKNPRVRLAPLFFGASQEGGLRSGTLDVPGIVGFGEAARLAGEALPIESERLRALRDMLLARLRTAFPDLRVNGSMTHRLPNNLNISIPCVEGESLLLALSRVVAVSSGSACTSATLEPSHVLRALGLPDEAAHASIRFGLSRFNDEHEVEQAAALVIEHARRLRAMSPLNPSAPTLACPPSAAHIEA